LSSITLHLGDVLISGGKVPHILNVYTRWKCVVSFMLCTLYPRRMNPWYSPEVMETVVTGNQTLNYSGSPLTIKL